VITSTETPKLSVIVTAINGWPVLDRCLRGLQNQQGGIDAEILVVGCAQPDLKERVAETYPGVKCLYHKERMTIPALRSVGITQASGEIIVITEDRCAPSENWLGEIVRACRTDYSVVGGPIEPNGIRGILNWAVYLCEYSSLMLPMPEAEVGGLAGNNAAYRREALAEVPEQIKSEYWEYFLFEELRKKGIKVLFSPTIVTRKNIDFSFRYFLGQRFHYSRSFAGMRRERVTPLHRLVYAAFTPALPLLMTWRIAKPVLEKRRYIKELVLSLPLLCIFMGSYAAGEFAGYLFGPGRSLLKVE